MRSLPWCRGTFALLLLPLLAANDNDAGCNVFKSAAELCSESGGTWQGEGKNASCTCPATAPFWADGRGCGKCPAGDQTCELCVGSGGLWDSSACPPGCPPPACGDDPTQVVCASQCGSAPTCRCPAAQPTWAKNLGCRACEIGKCEGFAVHCSQLPDTADECGKQLGCRLDSDPHENCFGTGEDRYCYTYYTDDCEGSAKACDELTVEGKVGCERQLGCKWVN